MIEDAIEDATRTGSSIDLFLNGYRLAERKGGVMDIEKGQKLVLLHERRYGICEAEVVSVGRKWVTLNLGNPNYRFRIDDPQMTIDGRGYSSPGRCYLSREEFETQTRRSEAIGALCGVCRDLSYFNVSNDVTASAEEIEKVTEQLKRLFM